MIWKTIRENVVGYVNEAGRLVGYVMDGTQSRGDMKWVPWVAYYEGSIHGDYMGQAEAMTAIEKLHEEVLRSRKVTGGFLAALPTGVRGSGTGGDTGGGVVQ